MVLCRSNDKRAGISTITDQIRWIKVYRAMGGGRALDDVTPSLVECQKVVI